jgi:hypothetical protein
MDKITGFSRILRHTAIWRLIRTLEALTGHKLWLAWHVIIPLEIGTMATVNLFLTDFGKIG